MAGDSDVDADVLRESVEDTGAVILGRNLFDVVDAPDGWSEDMGYGAEHAAQPPMFVVTHEAPEEVRLASLFDHRHAKGSRRRCRPLGRPPATRTCTPWVGPT